MVRVSFPTDGAPCEEWQFLADLADWWGAPWNWKCCWKEAGASWHQSSDCPSVLGTAEATSWVLCPVLGHSWQEEHWGARGCPERGSGAGKGLEHKSERSSWGSRECYIPGKGDLRGIFSLCNSWKEGGARLGLVSSPKYQEERKWTQVVWGQV